MTDREGQRCDGSSEAGYGHHGSLADLFRQIGHDERVRKLESLAALGEPRLGDVPLSLRWQAFWMPGRLLAARLASRPGRLPPAQ